MILNIRKKSVQNDGGIRRYPKSGLKITQPRKVRSGGNSRSRHGPFSKFNGLKEHFLKSDSKTMQTKTIDDILHYESYEKGFFGQMPPPPDYPDKKRRL